MRDYTRAQFTTIANKIAKTLKTDKTHAFGVVIGVRLPYRKFAERIVATATTYEKALSIASHIFASNGDEIDYASPVWMHEYTMPRPKLLPKIR